MKKVLIVEDDPLISDLQRDYLEASDFEVVIEANGAKGLQLALKDSYSAIILDVTLPSKNGFEICKELHKHLQIPIVFVTAKKEEIDIVRGLSLGAVDYITKPFSPSELVARIKTHIANYERLTSGKESEICVGNLKIKPKSRRVFVENSEIILVKKEYELLYFLATNPDSVFSRETLFDRVWGGDTFGDISTVTVHMKRLRKKIEVDSTKPQMIQTVWGAGYRFSASN